MKGFISQFDSKKSFGFITTVEGEDVFFHKSDLEKGFLLVDFNIEQSNKGPRASKIKRVANE